MSPETVAALDENFWWGAHLHAGEHRCALFGIHCSEHAAQEDTRNA